MRWSWIPLTWTDSIQAGGWILLALVLPVFSYRVGVEIVRDVLGRRIALGLAALALGARLSVPLLPFNWYSGVANVSLSEPIWTKHTTYLPLPYQVLIFEGGFHAILVVGIVLGVTSTVVLWHVARSCGYGERVSLVFGLLLALTPTYVRLSASDSTHFLPFALWSLAAAATMRIARARAGLADELVLFLATALACPIRLEAGLMAPSVVLFVARDVEGWKALWVERRRWVALVLGLALGAATAIPYHAASWSERLVEHRFTDPLAFVVQMGGRLLFLADPEPFGGWVPIAYVLFIWYYVASVRRDRRELLATVGPFAILSVPFAWGGTAFFTELPSSAYDVVVVVFLLIPAAKGMALAWGRIERGELLRARWSKGIALAAAAATVWGGFVVPYRLTYAYMEEYRFLDRSLPRGRATVLTIWDPTCPGGDYDCSLALPYPTFLGDFPDLHWVVLTQADVASGRLRDLQFDYYYPGSLAALDLDRVGDWLPGRIFGSPELDERQREPLRRIRALDAEIRSLHPLEAWKTAEMPARTFSFAHFRDDRMTLTIFRRVAVEGGAVRADGAR